MREYGNVENRENGTFRVYFSLLNRKALFLLPLLKERINNGAAAQSVVVFQSDEGVLEKQDPAER